MNLRMITLFAVAAAAVANAAAPASAEETYGCIGLAPPSSALYRVCLGVDPAAAGVPGVVVGPPQEAGGTVPGVCYFLGCTEPQPVTVTVPVSVQTTEGGSGTITRIEHYYAHVGAYRDPYTGQTCVYVITQSLLSVVADQDTCND